MVTTRRNGTTLLILMVIISVMTVGLLVALPVWQTQMQREMEEELIFRGLQYVEAIRIYQMKNPGTFPRKLEDLVKDHCLRRLYQDPMTKVGRWNVILRQDSMAAPGPRPGGRGGADQPVPGSPGAATRLLLVPESSLSSISNPLIIGVASSSPKKSFRIYEDNETYDTWLFYYGSNPATKPEIIRYGQLTKRP